MLEDSVDFMLQKSAISTLYNNSQINTAFLPPNYQLLLTSIVDTQLASFVENLFQIEFEAPTDRYNSFKSANLAINGVFCDCGTETTLNPVCIDSSGL